MSQCISAYVPCFNNAATVRRAVESLLAQTIAPAEVLVIDDGSTDDSIAQLHDLPIRIVRHERNLGRGAARARAMAELRQELVLSCDAGMALARDFVANAMPWFAEPSIAAVFGRIEQPGAKAVADRWRRRHLFKVTRQPSGVRHRAALITGGTLLRKSAADRVGGFDVALRHSEDGDLGRRLLEGGFDVVSDPRLVLSSIASDTVAQVLERYWRWYAGADEAVSLRGYWKNIGYAIKVMAAEDLRACDPLAAAISLITPHYQFWKSWGRNLGRGPSPSHRDAGRALMPDSRGLARRGRASNVRVMGASLRCMTASVLRRVPGSSTAFGPPRREVASTMEWQSRAAAEDGGRRGKSLSERRPTERRMPAHADAAMLARFAAMGSGAIKARFVGELDGARFWGRGYGYVIDRDDALHHELSPAFTDFAEDVRTHDGLQVPWLPRVRRMPGTVAALGTPFCENFHHWLLDTLPKFGLLRDAGWTIERLDALLLPAGANRPWHRQALERLGVPWQKILFTDARTHLQPDRLVVPSYSEPGRAPERFDYTPEGIAFVRALVGGVGGSAGLPTKLLISREKAASRRWQGNASERKRLEREGFVTVRLEEYSIREQAALFRAARQIVMPTGGNLANLVFCEPGARVVELFSPAYLPTFSLVLAGPLGLDYRALVGPNGDVAGRHHDAGAAEDVDVPVERILEQLA